MKEALALFFSFLFLIQNIHSLNIKKNENSLGKKKSIIYDFLNHKFEINKKTYDDRTQINLILYKNQKNQKEISMPLEQELVKNIADYLRKDLDKPQIQQVVDEAVLQLQDLADQQICSLRDIQQAVEQVLEQLPEQVAKQIQDTLQELPNQHVTPQQVQQVIDQVQKAQQQVAQQQFNNLGCQDIAPLEEFVNDLFFKVQDLLNFLTRNNSLLKSFKKSTDDENAENAASNLLDNYINSFNKLMADLSTVEEATNQADDKCKSQLHKSITQTQTSLLQVKSQLTKFGFLTSFFKCLIYGNC